jgi:hypothetical protein
MTNIDKYEETAKKLFLETFKDRMKYMESMSDDKLLWFLRPTITHEDGYVKIVSCFVYENDYKSLHDKHN